MPEGGQEKAQEAEGAQDVPRPGRSSRATAGRTRAGVAMSERGRSGSIAPTAWRRVAARVSGACERADGHHEPARAAPARGERRSGRACRVDRGVAGNCTSRTTPTTSRQYGFSPPYPNALADRALVGPEPPRRGFVDHGHERAVGPHVSRERRARDHRDPEGSEESGADARCSRRGGYLPGAEPAGPRPEGSCWSRTTRWAATIARATPSTPGWADEPLLEPVLEALDASRRRGSPRRAG